MAGACSASVVLAGEGRAEALAPVLSRHGFGVRTAPEAAEAGRALCTGEADAAVVLDDLRGEEPLTFCRRMRSVTDAPLILLTPMTEPLERVVALEAGADDCVSEPVDGRELVARLRAVLRRGGGTGLRPVRAYGFAGWTLDLATQQLAGPDGEATRLPRSDFLLLQALAEHARTPLSKARLAERVGATDGSSGPRVVDYAVYRLRRRMGRAADELIRTAPRFGYVLAAPVERIAAAA